MRFLLDTNAVSALIKGHPGLSAQLRRYDAHDFGLPAVVMHELAFGAYKGQRTEQTLRTYDQLPFAVVPFTDDDARAAGQIRAHLQAIGNSIGAYDVLIAGQAVARGLTVVTRNTSEFSRVPDLRWEDWES